LRLAELTYAAPICCINDSVSQDIVLFHDSGRLHGKPTEAGSPDHRLDESPAGYSSAGWSPPEPASASPTEDDSGGDEVV